MSLEAYNNQYRKYINFIEKYRKASNASTGSEVDANANVENKNVTTCTGELYKREAIGANRLLMIEKITKLYGKDLAEEYIRQLDSHEVYRHDETNPMLPYCVSITMYPFLFEGLTNIGGFSEAPKNLDSFCGAFINLVFAVASQFAGAVATPEFLMYLDYFIRKDYGDDYYKITDKQVDMKIHPKTLNDVIEAKFQQVVYSLNQPAAARNFQSVFWNIAYFDHPYFDGMFSDFVFPDGSTPTWDSVSWLQKKFMKWFNSERLKQILTFPVETVNLLNNGMDCVDQDWKDFTAEMWSEGHSFFCYTSNSVDSLASCCYSKDTKVIIKDSAGAYLLPFEEIEHKKFTANGYKIFNNGKWSEGKLVKLPSRKMYKITTSNNKVMCITDNHRNNCIGGTILTKDLTTSDYIMFNSTAFDTFHEKDEKLTYEQGFAVGAFLGDGSFGSTMTLSDGTNQIYDINYSINEEKKWIVPIIDLANNQCGSNGKCNIRQVHNNVLPVRLSSKNLVEFISKWTNWKRGTSSATKQINMNCLLQSIDFRKGIIDGWYATDGNMNSLKYRKSLRGYSTSKNMIEELDAICVSLGYITSISLDERMENPVFRGIEYKKNFPVYCLLKYCDNKQNRLQNHICKFKDNSYYFRIKKIEEIEYSDNVYCFEMKDKTDDKFTLPNGIHNFNCRLKNEVKENTFSYTLGAGGVSTGSKGVMTINLNRLIQNLGERPSLEDISNAVSEQVKKIHKYMTAYNEIVKDNYNSHLLPVYEAGYISLDKQYLTLGINGFVEGAEFLGIEPTPNEEYFKYGEAVLKPIYDLDKLDRTEDIMWNCEFVPAENLGVKNAKWDKKDGYFVPRDCYNSYFYRVEDDNVNIIDKFILHGNRLTKYLDGGSALHENLDEHLSKQQYLHLIDVAIKTGCSYFTFNIPNTICNDCGHISKHKLSHCPKCNSENLDYATRVIGYLKRVSNFSEDRQKEARQRYYEKS